jgi:hypothetical protein
MKIGDKRYGVDGKKIRTGIVRNLCRGCASGELKQKKIDPQMAILKKGFLPLFPPVCPSAVFLIFPQRGFLSQGGAHEKEE